MNSVVVPPSKSENVDDNLVKKTFIDTRLDKHSREFGNEEIEQWKSEDSGCVIK